jgi:GntR family transcriptional regulator
LNRSPIPKYFQIQQEIRGRIAGGDYPAGAQLPTEGELAAEFRVSRQSIRTAMQALVNDGVVSRTAGKGTFVTEPAANDDSWTVQSLDDVISLSFRGTRELVSHERVTAKAHKDAARELHAGPDDALLFIKTRRQIAAGPYAIARVYMPYEFGKLLSRDELSSKPVVQLLEERCRIPATRTRQVASAVAADEELSKYLDTKPGSALLLLKRTYFSADNIPIEYAENFYRPDRYNEVTDLFRRKNPAQGRDTGIN